MIKEPKVPKCTINRIAQKMMYMTTGLSANHRRVQHPGSCHRVTRWQRKSGTPPHDADRQHSTWQPAGALTWLQGSIKAAPVTGALRVVPITVAAIHLNAATAARLQ